MELFLVIAVYVLPMGFLLALAYTRSLRDTLWGMGFLALYSLAFLGLFVVARFLFA